MKSYIHDVLSVYFNKKQALHNQKSQVCLWTINCWSVHHSQEFCDWMHKNYPWILVWYIPGGCTGIFQLCDVSIQWILKHAMKKMALSHIIKETIVHLHLNNNEDPRTILLTEAIKVLQNQLVEWLVDGYKAINKPEVVKKVCTSHSPTPANLSTLILGLEVMQSW